jgi:hypothetical protein
MIAKKLNEKIEELKNGLIYNNEFQEIFNYFIDVVTADPHFTSSSKALPESSFISNAIKYTLKSLYEKMLFENKDDTASLTEDSTTFLITQCIKKAGFYHGPIAMYGGMGCYIYFEKQKMGLLNIKFPGSDKVWYSRFTALEAEKGVLSQFANIGGTATN